ncbi:methyltransferase domain-containing protein [Rhizobium viscosum]|uniref:SAM-dependent methyltransferase n=1 Tax=Rhizobium viscosum TaxID=1673 RepID=A0ABR9IM54_RHIVS|nr:methyltransferase domain-containing protein [Rhizobium viscosum]MBE1504263.1 SAM-dependent methyltransferase [Rhizobium viscosum]
MLKEDFYLLGHGEAESRRLLEQTELLVPEAERFVDRLKVTRGARVVDLGCGPRGLLDILAARVGIQGQVIGVERNAVFAEAARRLIAAERIANVEIVEADAKASGLPSGAFDLVTARLVLVNVPEPERIVAEMAGLVRPGGIVASYEADFGVLLCDPPSQAWDRSLEIYAAYAETHGVDLFIGRKTHRLLRDVGLVEIEVSPIVNIYPPGHARRTILLDFVTNCSDALIHEKFADESELNDLIAALRYDLADPGRLVTSHLFYETIGRKPLETSTASVSENYVSAGAL